MPYRLGVSQRRCVALLLALAQGFCVQAFEVDRLQEERREAAGLDQVADQLAHVREQDVRALGAEQHVDRLRVQADQAEHAGLLHFGHVGGALTGLAGQGHGQHDFEGVLTQALHLLVQVQLQLRLHLVVKMVGAFGDSKETSLT